MTTPPLLRRAAATALLLAAGLTAVAGYPHMAHLAAQADDGWWPWVAITGTYGLLLGSALMLLSVKGRSPSAWLAVAVSIPVNVAVILAPDSVWAACLVGIWPCLAVGIGARTFLHHSRRFNDRQEVDR